MNKCISQLEGSKEIKVVKNVKFPTRKVYMLSSITPSIELTGGPWYTDNELDMAMIEMCTRLALKFVTELVSYKLYMIY